MSSRLLAAALLVLAACEATPDTPPPAATSAARSPDAPDAGPADPDRLSLVLPTANRALFEDAPERFYQGLNVTIDSMREEKWEGGQYGFVRDPVPAAFGRRTFRRVHEGIDIAPAERDSLGEPVDTVMAIDRGVVAYVNTGASAYGNYVVVEHDWSDSPVYSLYAHLADTAVAEGDTVAQGARLGTLGYTGRGINRERAHVHLEIAFLINRHEGVWFEEYIGSADTHGLFFGPNLAGVPPAGLFLALRENPDLTFPEYVASLAESYVIDLPGGQPLDLIERYPWLGPEAAAADPAAVPAWRIEFTQEGAPMRVEVARTPVERATVDGVSLRIWLTSASTNRVLQRRGISFEPTQRGYRTFALYSTTAGQAPRW